MGTSSLTCRFLWAWLPHPGTCLGGATGRGPSASGLPATSVGWCWAGSLCLRSARHLCGVVLLPMPTRWEAAVRSYHIPLPLTPSSFCTHLTILACWGRGQPSHGSPNRTPFSDLVSEKLKSGGPPAWGSPGRLSGQERKRH